MASDLPEMFVIAEDKDGNIKGFLRTKRERRFREVTGAVLDFKQRIFSESDEIKIITKDGNEMVFSDFETMAYAYPSPNGALIGEYEVEIEGEIKESMALKKIGGSKKATYISVGNNYLFVKKNDLVIIEPFENVYPYLETFDGATTDLYMGDDGYGIIIGKPANIPIVKLGRYGVHIVGWLRKNRDFAVGAPEKVFITRRSAVYVDETSLGFAMAVSDITPPGERK